jgi:D-beta-D-heptose 7-phosphate kinase/D-beta-D-heptose 1-phosphate adenosyltransferase
VSSSVHNIRRGKQFRMKKLLEILHRFHKAHLLVVGDLILDRFIWGDVERISPEAPVPVLRVVSESSRLGGAANVIHNIRSLAGQATACGVIGADGPGRTLLADLRRIGASTAGVFADAAYQTIQKSRVIARPRHQQIVRLDRENHGAIRQATLAKIRRFVAQRAIRSSGIVISDYGKGVVHHELLDLVSGLVESNNCLCVIDPKKENYSRYRRPTLVTPNRDEASEASGIVIRDERSLVSAGRKLVREWQAQAVLITRGPDGMSLFRPRGTVKHFPTEPRDVFEVTGAGDTVVAVCALALACGADPEDAAIMANLAAGLVGDEVGTVAVPLERLKRAIEDKQ